MTRRRISDVSVRYLLVAALMITSVIVPVQVPFSSDIGESLVAAQSAVVDGTPTDCSTVWPPDHFTPGNSINTATDESECIWRPSPCPLNPMFDRMSDPKPLSDADTWWTQPAPDHARFCEQQLSWSTHRTRYDNCREYRPYGGSKYGQLLGAVVDPGPTGFCTVRVPERCPTPSNDSTGKSISSSRISFTECIAIVRRTWTCPANYVPMNTFNDCALQLSAPPVSGSLPPCGAGAPTFTAMSCEEYVGVDFLTTPTSVLCTSYDAGTTPGVDLTAVSSNRHWCKYDLQFLNHQCHVSAPPANCVSSSALCLKRQTQIGGCGNIANSIRCSEMQQKELHSSGTSDFTNFGATLHPLYLEGCSPCTAFSCAGGLDECPEWFSVKTEPNEPRSHNPNEVKKFTDILDSKSDFLESGTSLSGTGHQDVDMHCIDPPHGHLAWASNHSSSHAVINSPITFTVTGFPKLEALGRRSFQTFVGVIPQIAPTPLTPQNAAGLQLFSRDYLLYAEGGDDPVIRPWTDYSAIQGASMQSLIDGPVHQDNIGYCEISPYPRVRLEIEELWPNHTSGDYDTANTEHVEAIKDLFGAETLDWWDDLSAAQQIRYTQARQVLLNETVDCSVPSDVADSLEGFWCRWAPPRSGYFRVKAVAAWRQRFWLYPGRWYGIGPNCDLNNVTTCINQHLADLATRESHETPDASLCTKPYKPHSYWSTLSGPTSSNWMTNADASRHCIQKVIDETGLTAAQFGLKADLTGTLPHPSGSTPLLDLSEEIFDDPRWLGCPSQDVRIDCRNAAKYSTEHRSANYTETPWVGIPVHEVRTILIP